MRDRVNLTKNENNQCGNPSERYSQREKETVEYPVNGSWSRRFGRPVLPRESTQPGKAHGAP